jgi:DHA2 family methylenomycin A resistance protein-like MFS transporter
MSISAAGLAVLAFSAASAPYVVVAIGFAVFALGLTLVAPAQTLVVMSCIPDQHRNMASSALNTARQTGGVIGVASLGAIAAGHPATGTPTAMGVAVAACLASVIGASRFIPRSLHGEEPSGAPTRAVTSS